MFDSSITFIKNKPIPVSGNYATTLSHSRLGKHFDITKPGEHRGLFSYSLPL